MKSSTKLKISLILSALLLSSLLIFSNTSNAAANVVTTEEDLVNAINEAGEGMRVIMLDDDITLTKNVSISKNIFIEGDGHTITASEQWQQEVAAGIKTGDQSLITVTKEGMLNLENVVLTNAPKYGVQAFEGTVALMDVTIKDCKYGGVLVNGGTVIIDNLHLGYNGTGANNGIEIDRGSSTMDPRLIMDSKLTSTEKENVIRAATNSNLKEFELINTDTAEDSIFVSNGKIILADEDGNIISESAIGEGITYNVTYNPGATERVLLTIVANNTKVDVALNKGTSITSEFVEGYVTLAEGDTIDGFFKDKEYSEAFDFKTVVNEDTTIYVQITSTGIENDNTQQPQEIPEKTPEKDSTPDTGLVDVALVASVVAMVSVAGIVAVKKYSK